ncbi:NAD(+)/NADH kinase [Oscillospiraceae bacterium OttesenSCG-928-F05]|nr:NAD(+)/NADH kinase [Oscillospiraceae bacterium OttesenSCG-928-F05]
MKKFLLYTNPHKDPHLRMTDSVAALITGGGGEVLRPPEAAHDDLSAHMSELLPLIRKADVIVTLGGDGTILRIAGAAAEAEKPILGINLGRLGFLTEIEASEIDLICQKLLPGKYTVDTRMMAHTSIERGSETLYHGLSLNDAVVTNGERARIVALKLWADGHLLTALKGDGVIVATPSGSTAYSLAAGGPVIAPHADVLTVTPVCAHGLGAKSFVLPGDSTVYIENVTEGEKAAYLTVDGRQTIALALGDRVKIVKSRRKCLLIRLKNRNFYDIVSEKLG